MSRLRTIAVWGLLASAYCCSTSVAQVNSTWNGTTGNWTDATRWSTNPLFPNNGNGGQNYDATVIAGSVTVNQNINLHNLGLIGGQITGPEDLYLLDSFVWIDGTVSGTGDLSMRYGAIFGPSTKTLNARTLTVRNELAWYEGPIESTNLGTIIVEDGAEFLSVGDHIGVREFEGNVIVNPGGKVTIAGSQATGFRGELVNNGVVEVEAGSVLFPAIGSGSGDFIIRNNAGLIFELNAASDYQFNGRIILDGGIFDILLFAGGSVEFLLPNYLSGNGTFDANGGTLIVDGTISPGFSVGHIVIQGNAQFTDTALAEIEIATINSFDTIEITGDVTLGGTLSLAILDSGSIQAGDTFDIITANDILGTRFDDVILSGVDDLLVFPIYESDRVAALVADKGDLNPFMPGIGDDDISAFALALTNPNGYRSLFGISAREAGDIDGDGDCDVDDIDDFADLLGMSLSQLTYQMHRALAVPEPTGGVIALLGIACLGIGRQSPGRFART